MGRTASRRCLGFLTVSGIAALAATPASSQEDRERFCEAPMPCTPSVLGVAFGDSVDGPSTLSTALPPGATVDATVFLDTREGPVFGWSYAIEHDAALLAIQPSACASADVDYLCGTDAQEARVAPSFNVSTRVEGEGGRAGFVSAVVLGFLQPAALVEGRRNSLARLTYSVVATPVEATRLRFVDRELSSGGPPVAVVLTIGSASFRPAELIHGVLAHTGAVENDAERCADGADNDGDGGVDCEDRDCAAFCKPAPVFRRGDTDANGRINVTDAVIILHALFAGLVPDYDCLDARDADDDGSRTLTDGIVVLDWLFRQGLPLPAPSLECGVDPSADSLDCAASSAICG